MARGLRVGKKTTKKVQQNQSRGIVTSTKLQTAFPGASISAENTGLKISINGSGSSGAKSIAAVSRVTQARTARNLKKIAKRSITTTAASFVDTKLSEAEMWSGAHTDSALLDSITAIKTVVPGFAYAEAYTVGENGQLAGKHAYLASDLLEKHGQAAEEHKAEFSSPDSEITKAFTDGKAVVMTKPTKPKKFGEAPFNSGFVVPIRHNGKVKAVVRVFSQSETPLDQAEVDEVVGGIVAASMYGNTKHFEALPFKQHNKNVSLETQKDVYLGLVANGVFTPARAFAEVNSFFKMGFAPVYFKRFAPRVIANHIQAFIASKQFAQASANPEEVWLAIENNVKFMGGLPPEQSFHIVPTEQRKVFAVERNIIRRVNHIPANKNYSLEMSQSHEPIVAGSKKSASMYVLQTHDYAHPQNVGNEAVTDLAQVCSTTFMKHKPQVILDRYQEVISDAASSLAPITKVFPAHKDGSIPVMFAFRARGHAGAHANYLLQMTQLLENNKLRASRKYVETFANNVTVMSLYLDPAEAEKINTFTTEFSTMSLTPQSDVLTPQFLAGSLSAEEYTYLSATSKVLYYVISSQPDEYKVLSKHLSKESDPSNLGRLRDLYTSIRREAISHSRIQKTMLKYPELAKAIYADFEKRNTTDQVNGPKIEANTALETLIKRNVAGPLEQQIFQAMLSFNKHVPKTNFYRGEKAAISFRLEPEFFADMDLPRLPFGVFFTMGADFQAFHVRFADVSRGGIRLIQSRDENVYSKNVATQFNETFNLAFTQNLKNKDIPEFGSKGTVLLNPDSQHQGTISFQRFVDSLLDLITDQKTSPGHPNHIVNNYGKPELLFLGPDEGTAGVMQWAAMYSKKRGYKYPLAFTTGKPASLGGIPHDVYGMTTNSVHRYVVGALKKLGLNEEECTKVQTGGPDGDLGSNEVLISKDKTIAIVDGSGVLYDPKGINREELTRLCKKRVMAGNFNREHLSPEGFFISVDDKDFTLPDGTVVESGVNFRNEFHLSKFSTGDLFVPCGGRPASIDLSNVRRMFDPKTGKPKFKVIIEGANLFITQDARSVLEEAGVVLYKDASSNKGGVTSSSLEVLAALSLPVDIFEKNMAVHDPKNPPQAYDEYAREIQSRVIENANLEFECIWREHERTGQPRYILTDKVSNKINTLNDFIHASNLWDNKSLRTVVLRELLPKKLQQLAGFETLVATAPESYLKASFSAYLASRYVYKHGIDASEFAFYDFMQPYTEAALALDNEKK